VIDINVDDDLIHGIHGWGLRIRKDITKKQVEDGARVIDINVDDDWTDGLAAMQTFVKIAVEPLEGVCSSMTTGTTLFFSSDPPSLPVLGLL